ESMFAGFDNYVQALSNANFVASIGRMVLFGVVQVTVMIVAATILALLLETASAKWPGFFRATYFLPYGIPGVIATILWSFRSREHVRWFRQLRPGAEQRQFRRLDRADGAVRCRAGDRDDRGCHDLGAAAGDREREVARLLPRHLLPALRDPRGDRHDPVVVP